HMQTRRLQNAASQAAERYTAHFAARDWGALAEVMAEDIVADDRRGVVNAGARRGRNAEIENMRAAADVGITHMKSAVIATRGERLVLSRVRTTSSDDGPERFEAEVLGLTEIDAQMRIAAYVVFDPNDFDSATAELDARYLAGEAAPYAQTWSVIMRAYAAVNRLEAYPTTPSWVQIDHRVETAFGAAELFTYLRAGRGADLQGHTYNEAVHRLGDLGAVITYAVYGTSPEGFEAELRGVALLTVEGDMISRTELFDETDLDAAIAKFEELQPKTWRLENAASRATERSVSYFPRDWDALAQSLARDISVDDRRRVVGAGLRVGRDVTVADLRVIADLGMSKVSST